MRKHFLRSSPRRRGRRTSSLIVEIQSLEPRALPAGTVTVNVVDGDIKLIGDNSANSIEVDLQPNGIFVRGFDGTNIKLGASLTMDGSAVQLSNSPTVLRDLVINLKGGADTLALHVGDTLSDGFVHAVIGRNLKIEMGAGFDQATIELFISGPTVNSLPSLTVNNEMKVDLGTESDYFLADGFWKFAGAPADYGQESSRTEPISVIGNTKIVGGSGDDIVSLQIFSTVGNLQIETGSGNDTVSLNHVSISGSASIFTGASNDDLLMTNTTIRRGASLDTGSGNDRVVIGGDFSEINRRILIRLQSGNDTLVFQGLTHLGQNVVIDGGSGSQDVDTLAVAFDPNRPLPPKNTFRGFDNNDGTDIAGPIIDDIFSKIFRFIE